MQTWINRLPTTPNRIHMARTNISVDQNVFEAFSAEAERQNKTLFAFANESLSVITKVASEGGNPSDLYGIWRSMTLLKQFDIITLPADFVDDVTAEALRVQQGEDSEEVQRHREQVRERSEDLRPGPVRAIEGREGFPRSVADKTADHQRTDEGNLRD